MSWKAISLGTILQHMLYIDLAKAGLFSFRFPERSTAQQKSWGFPNLSTVSDSFSCILLILSCCCLQPVLRTPVKMSLHQRLHKSPKP